MKTIKMLISAIALIIGAGAAQAEHQVEWKYPHKGAPYPVRVDHSAQRPVVYGSPLYSRHTARANRHQHSR